MRIQQIAGAATAFLFAGLAPALVMAALWHTAQIAPIVFAFTFAIALGHVSTPEEKCIDFPEQKYISEAGKKGR